MNVRTKMWQFMAVLMICTLMAGCVAPTATPAPPSEPPRSGRSRADEGS